MWLGQWEEFHVNSKKNQDANVRFTETPTYSVA